MRVTLFCETLKTLRFSIVLTLTEGVGCGVVWCGVVWGGVVWC